jgi:hypothetical protein
MSFALNALTTTIPDKNFIFSKLYQSESKAGKKLRSGMVVVRTSKQQ